MSSRRKVALSGLVGVTLALILMGAAALSGVPVINLPTTSGNNQQPGGSTTTLGSSTTGGNSPGNGMLSILMTDPPRVPAGVTDIYVSYSGLAVQGAGGWTSVKDSGSVELMGTVNIAKTLASASLSPGSYNQVRFDVSSAEITFDGVNYTAVVQGGQMSVRLHDDVNVSENGAAAALIDIQPTVVNVGTSANPQFVVWANIHAFPVPANQVVQGMEREGNDFSLVGMKWWQDDAAQANATLQISGVSLSSSSLALTLKNVGTDDARVKLVVVTQANLGTGSENGDETPTEMTGSAVFVVLPNGTLVQFMPVLHMMTPMIVGENGSQLTIFDALLMSGYNLTAGATADFSYAGSIQLGFGMLTPTQTITAGGSFMVMVIGDGTVASAQVTSS